MNPYAAILGTTRIARIVSQVLDTRIQSQNLIWSGRIPTDDNVPEGEVMLRESGRVTIADIVADDAAALVRTPEAATLVTTKVPSIKHGLAFSTDQLMGLSRIVNSLGGAGQVIPSQLDRNAQNDLSSIDAYMSRQLAKLILGVRMRKEALLCALVTDSFSYDKLGIKATGVSFGKPAELKVTPGVPWSTSASATPVSDILALRNLASQKYGIVYDRITLSNQAFLHLIRSVEYQNLVKAQPVALVGTNAPAEGQLALQTRMASMILEMTIEIDDRQFQTEATSGTFGVGRYIPETTVVLSSTALDGDLGTWDFANTIVAESLVNSLAGAGVSGFDRPTTGPVGYATLANADLNPPGVVLWAVQRGFPRLHQVAATAVLNSVYTP